MAMVDLIGNRSMAAVHVDLWLWSLHATPSRLYEARQILSPDEIARAERFVRPADRDMYIAARARLREILGMETGRAACDLVFDYGPNGKPALPGGPGFNLSHSGGLAALAVCADGAPGIDIEQIRPIEDAVARRYFTAEEYRQLGALPDHHWLDGFYRCWTRKEAVVKAVGLGLSMPLTAFDVTLTPNSPAHITRIDGQDATNWTLLHLDPAEGFVGALALQANRQPVEVNWRETL